MAKNETNLRFSKQDENMGIMPGSQVFIMPNVKMFIWVVSDIISEV